MPTHRSTIVWLCAALLLAFVGASVAQAEVETIYIAKVKVITLREKGTFPSLAERAKSIDKAIVEILSTQDTLHPKVSVKQVGNLWTVFCGPVQVASVFPAEAKANGLPEKTLASVWAKNLAEALPKATPASKLPPSAFQGGAGGAAPVKPSTPPVKPVEPVAPVSPSGPAPAGPVPPVEPSTPSVPASPAAIGAPILLVREAFNTVRLLPEEEYVARRDELAGSLINDLTPFITGKVPSVLGSTPSGPITPVNPVTPVTPVAPAGNTGVAPSAGTGGEPPALGGADLPLPGADTAVAPVAGDTAPPSKSASTIATGPAAVDLPTVKPGDPAYAKVPQKNRIREMLEKSREPYMALDKEDPQAAKPVQSLLAACRTAYAAGRYDQAEQYVKSALDLLGVKY
jgi:hypothetical protein